MTNHDARYQDDSCNIQKIEYPERNTLFEQFKNSPTISENKFIKDLNELISFPEDYNIKVYLTWSSSHKMHPSSITYLNGSKNIEQ